LSSVTCVGRRKSTFSNAILRTVSAMLAVTVGGMWSKGEILDID
jgi:hypothetical protein